MTPKIRPYQCEHARTRRGGRLCPPGGACPQKRMHQCESAHCLQGSMPRSPRTPHIRFYETPRQICRCPNGRTEASAPTERFSFSSMACTIFRLRVAGSMRRPQASFEAQPRAARLLAPKMGIDPYGDFAWSPFIVRFCDCILHGRGRTPPLRQIITSSRFTITSYLSCPAPTLRLKPSPEDSSGDSFFSAARYVSVSVPRSFPAR